MSKKIFATNNPTKYAIVDDDVYEIIQQMKLKFGVRKTGYWYSTTEIKLPGMAEKKCLLLHRFVFILKTGEEPESSIDHEDRDKSNNQFENLRLATTKEQQQHRGKQKNNSSGYIGVTHVHHVDKRRKNWSKDYWRARIRKPDGNNKSELFDYDDTGLIAAAKWHDSKAIEYFGNFAGEFNFPDEIE